MTYEDTGCYQPGWDEGGAREDESLMCEKPSDHDGPHGAFLDSRFNNPVEWPVTWTVEDDGSDADATYSMTADPSGN